MFFFFFTRAYHFDVMAPPFVIVVEKESGWSCYPPANGLCRDDDDGDCSTLLDPLLPIALVVVLVAGSVALLRAPPMTLLDSTYDDGWMLTAFVCAVAAMLAGVIALLVGAYVGMFCAPSATDARCRTVALMTFVLSTAMFITLGYFACQQLICAKFAIDLLERPRARLHAAVRWKRACCCRRRRRRQRSSIDCRCARRLRRLK